MSNRHIRSASRGNSRTRGGAGRHNIRVPDFDSPHVAVRTCLGCDRSFKSRGPWNRFCRRCSEGEDVDFVDYRPYRVPREWSNDD